MKRDIILLPSLLLASGFESLSTQDIKFLNNYRKHFDKTKYNLEEIFIVTESDYELGGIMNPYNQMNIPSKVYDLCKSSIPAFPYATREDIKEIVYKQSVDNLFQGLLSEIFSEITHLFEKGDKFIKEAISEQKFSLQCLESIKVFPFYQKVVALHLCGFGTVISDSFNKMLSQYLEEY